MSTEGKRRGVERFNKRNSLVTKWARPKPFCAIPYGERVTLEIFIPPLADFLAGKLEDKPHKAPTFLRPLIADLNDYKKLALMGVAPLLDCMTWERDDPSAAAKLKLKVGAEMEAQMAFIAPWTEEDRLRAGHWLVSQTLRLDLFDVTDGFPKISAKWLPELEQIREEMIRVHPVHMPVFEPPPPWTDFFRKCPDRLRVPFVRGCWPEQRAAIEECLKDPNWEPARGVHAQELVPFLIDTFMRDLVEEYAVDVMGHDYQQRWDDEQTVKDDIRTAKYIGTRPFYLERNVDYRGRINSVCHFSFDRGDHVRSMFRFARPMSLDPSEPTFWLEVHCANCYGNGIDKKSWDERAKWVAENREKLILKVAKDPEATFDLWKGADSPFCFVAACRELKAALEDLGNFETHLPIGFDGTCNGLQHLSLIASDPDTARLVNVYPNPDGTWPHEPQDVYAVVVAETQNLLTVDENPWASWWRDRFDKLRDKDTRKLIKTPAMTYAYAATQSTMGDEIREVYKTLPCADSQPSYDASRPEGKRDGCYYLAGKVMEACRSLLPKPTGAMERIQHLAQQRIDRGLHLEWINPSGFPVLSRHHKPKKPETFNLITYGVRVRHDLAVEYEDEIDKTKAINAAAANLVHSLDAAHAVRTTIAANRQYIRDIITTHDCYYCHAPQVRTFVPIIHGELLGMYHRSDVLEQLHNRNAGHSHSCSIHCTHEPLPPAAPRLIPRRDKAALDPLAVTFADFSFS
jgi:DNA-dependent RNA polymerase-like protein